MLCNNHVLGRILGNWTRRYEVRQAEPFCYDPKKIIVLRIFSLYCTFPLYYSLFIMQLTLTISEAFRISLYTLYFCGIDHLLPINDYPTKNLSHSFSRQQLCLSKNQWCLLVSFLIMYNVKLFKHMA